jgi:DNA invertase Pin-like site-specific DNA recombinase
MDKSGKRNMTVYGYARVSTEGQPLTAQVAELKAAGCQRVFQEKINGSSRADRKQLARLLVELDAGDKVIVTQLDRLARSTRDLLNILDAIGKARRGSPSSSVISSLSARARPRGRRRDP